MDGLEAATLKELVAEIKKRVSGMVMFAETEPDGEQPDGTFNYYSKGGISLILGMIERGRMIYRLEAAACEEIDPEPEPEEDDE